MSNELHLPDIGVAGIAIPEARRFRRAGNAGGIVLHLEDAKLASRYMGVVIRGVKVGASPPWLVDRLAAVGSRSINNIVDATNYVLHELGQPTHAFDLAKIPGARLEVRWARGGERVVTLDGQARDLRPDIGAIAGPDGVLTLAGIMGGASTEVSRKG